jgi:hypothetical protein
MPRPAGCCRNIRLRRPGHLAKLPQTFDIVLEIAVACVNALATRFGKSINYLAERSTQDDYPFFAELAWGRRVRPAGNEASNRGEIIASAAVGCRAAQ